MSLTKFTGNVSNHFSQPDKPAMTASELKLLFDKAPEDIKKYLNDVLIPEIDAILAKTLKSDDIENDISAGGASKVASAETIKSLNNLKQNKIPYGPDIPLTLKEGEIYLQVFVGG